MQEQKLRELASKKLGNSKLFVKFMQLRFPNEQDQLYVMEWVVRFSTGNPVAYMDGQSKACYSQAIKEV